MYGISFIAILFIILAYTLYYSTIIPAQQKRLKKRAADSAPAPMYPIFLLLAAALLADIIGAVCYVGYQYDVHCFSSWASMVYENGFSKFYTLDAFTDYPPGYMYVLYVIGFIKSIFHMEVMSTATVVLVKMPAILCDLAVGFLVYNLARKHTDTTIALILAGLYLCNPTVYTDSALWGQVDGVLTLCIMAIVLCTYYRKLIPAYFLFAVSILVKPQALFVTPVLIYAVIEQVFLQDFSWKKFWKNLGCGICAIGLLFILMYPFGVQNVISQYTDTLGSYPHASVNAANIWSMFKMNWAPLQPWMSVTGMICIMLIVAATAVIFFRSKDDSKYFFVAAFLFFATFVLSTKMHERYAFPCIAMLLCAYVLKQNIQIFSLYTLCSVTQFLNIGYVLFLWANDSSKYHHLTPAFIISSVLMVAMFVYMLFVSYKLYVKPQKITTGKAGKRR